uniref:Uncharacterized protein n=1 Tax=Anopheles stephensi TaxID=30069 RepID=A0A182YBN3_ANOST
MRQLVAQCPTPYFVNGEVKIRNRGRMVRFDCSYGFKLVGNRYSNCQNGRWDTSTPVCVKSGCDMLPDVASGYVLYELNKATAWLSCFEGTELAGSRNTYCNGTHWDRPLGVCRRTGQSTATTCDFEAESLCGWSNDALHDFDWKRSDGTLNPRALRTGPKYDHTTMQPKAGHFMIVDSGEQLTNDTARFISPLFEPELSNGACFQFYYHMYGESVGTLNVYVKPMTSDLYDVKPVFVLQGNQKNVWHEGHVEVAQQTERFQIVIEASLGLRYKSDIAIDDVSLLQGESCRVPVEDSEDPPSEAENVPVKIDSCENRCGSSMAAVLNSSDTIVHCDCHEDCVTGETCCPDYRERCVFEVAGIVANVTSPTSTSTTSTTTTSTPVSTTTKPITTTQSDMVLQPVAESTTEELIAPGLAIAPNVPIEQLQKAPSLMKFFIYAISTVTFFLCILSVTYFYARKSRSSVLARLKEKSQKSGFEDIRFLAGEEDLDFNIGHGADVEEEQDAKNSVSKTAKATKEEKQQPEGNRISKQDTKSEVTRSQQQGAHVRDGDENTDSDDCTDDESGGAKKTSSKANKKPYQKYVKYHDEDMESTLL